MLQITSLKNWVLFRLYFQNIFFLQFTFSDKKEFDQNLILDHQRKSQAAKYVYIQQNSLTIRSDSFVNKYNITDKSSTECIDIPQLVYEALSTCVFLSFRLLTQFQMISYLRVYLGTKKWTKFMIFDFVVSRQGMLLVVHMCLYIQIYVSVYNEYSLPRIVIIRIKLFVSSWNIH